MPAPRREKMVSLTPQEEAELKPLWERLDKLRTEKRKHSPGSPRRRRLLAMEHEVREECYRIAQRHHFPKDWGKLPPGEIDPNFKAPDPSVTLPPVEDMIAPANQSGREEGRT